jgi:hypothetical protein
MTGLSGLIWLSVAIGESRGKISAPVPAPMVLETNFLRDNCFVISEVFDPAFFRNYLYNCSRSHPGLLVVIPLTPSGISLFASAGSSTVQV